MRKLEAFFAVLIATMAVSFAVMFGETKPSGKELLIGNAHSNMWAECFSLYCILENHRSLLIQLLMQVWWFQS